VLPAQPHQVLLVKATFQATTLSSNAPEMKNVVETSLTSALGVAAK